MRGHARALPGCSRSGAPNSLFDSAGYHVKGDTVYFLQAFPGKAAQIDGADTASFKTLDRTFAKDASTVYVDGRPLTDADPASFVLLDRPDFAKDGDHVYQRDKVFSDDPAHFQLLGGNLAKDGGAVYWLDGRVLKGGYARDDSGIFYFTDRVVDADAPSFEVLDGSFARDARHAYWMGRPIPEADGSSFRVLNTNFECTADRTHPYYQDKVVVDGNCNVPAPPPQDGFAPPANDFFAPVDQAPMNGGDSVDIGGGGVDIATGGVDIGGGGVDIGGGGVDVGGGPHLA